MLTQIIDGIARELKKTYPKNKIYINEIEQGLQRPCFLIELLSQSQEQHLGRRLWREHSFDVHYFPEDEGSYEELHEVADTLRLALRYITIAEDDGSRLTLNETERINSEIVDKVLHFFFNVNLFVMLPKEDNPYMEDLEQRTKTAR